ncbi:hypothetical protein E4U42_008008 [Claviceps africana]|uniref:Methyltransferase type 11 domain-containing protein n=1 Tax=Claviceps africana TaxID=83212 RepID=A0A8K0NI52_9HYPO|nr:hypothetical protein E4U42_008008 [Claviceps africana]
MSSFEDTHVHAVYEAIAPHFSATRHSPWPFVKRFLLDQPPASIGFDIGCGNGKYLAVNPALHMLGCDRSSSLVALANQQHGRAGRDSNSKSNSNNDEDTTSGTNPRPAALLTADSLALPFRPRSADFIICIAVIHHFSTPERRRAAIEALLRCLRPGTGRALIYVWALEQGSSRRGWDEHSEQDTLVPWVMKRKKPRDKTPAPDADQHAAGHEDETYQRYYHLYRKGELEQDARHVGGEVCESGYERDNWWVILRTRSDGDVDVDVDCHLGEMT